MIVINLVQVGRLRMENTLMVTALQMIEGLEVIGISKIKSVGQIEHAKYNNLLHRTFRKLERAI